PLKQVEQNNIWTPDIPDNEKRDFNLKEIPKISEIDGPSIKEGRPTSIGIILVLLFYIFVMAITNWIVILISMIYLISISLIIMLYGTIMTKKIKDDFWIFIAFRILCFLLIFVVIILIVVLIIAAAIAGADAIGGSGGWSSSGKKKKKKEYHT
ncbi:unnamed protein product, partial [marine sediment metagenome]